ncbi:hypothetical protein ACLSYX_07525 [[Pasteurella] aerogenes]
MIPVYLEEVLKEREQDTFLEAFNDVANTSH